MSEQRDGEEECVAACEQASAGCGSGMDDESVCSCSECVEVVCGSCLLSVRCCALCVLWCCAVCVAVVRCFVA